MRDSCPRCFATFAFVIVGMAVTALASGDLPEGATVRVAPLTKAMWNQGRHYNRMCPTTDASDCCDGRMWAGCTAIATGIIMRYYNWPAQGQTWYQQLNDEKGWENDYTSLSLRARFDSPYDWEAMRDVYGNVTSARASLAVAQLVSDVGAVMNMQYGTSGSSTVSDNVPDVLTHNFHFDADELYDTTSFSPEVESRIQAQLSAGHPIVSSGAAGASGTGHTYVCDGYATTSPSAGTVTNLYHFNFGWGGASNGWYPLNAVFTQATASDTPYSRPVERMWLGVLPQKNPLILSASNVSGPEVDLQWAVPNCWSNALTGITVERQESQSVNVDVNLTQCWNVRTDGWGWKMSAGLPVAYSKYAWSGYWPTAGVNANMTNAIAVSASSVVRIKYAARKFGTGVTLSLIKSDMDGNDYDVNNNYEAFPTLANLPGGSSTSQFTTNTVEVTGSVLESAFGNDPAIFALKFADDSGDTTYYSETEVFKLISFTVSGEGKAWTTVESRELAATARSADFTELTPKTYRFKVSAQYGTDSRSSEVERTVVADPRTPVVAVKSLTGKVLKFAISGTDNFSCEVVTQSNAARGTLTTSGQEATFTFANEVASVGTHWVTLYVTDKVTGAQGQCTYITNPPEDHPLSAYCEDSIESATERANREGKLVLLVVSGDPDSTKFKSMSGILSSNAVVNAIADRYIVVEAISSTDAGYALGEDYWRSQPQTYGYGNTTYQPAITAYAMVINPTNSAAPYACDTLPSYYMNASSRWNYFNSQLDLSNLGSSYYVGKAVTDLVQFMGQEGFEVALIEPTLDGAVFVVTETGAFLNIQAVSGQRYVLLRGTSPDGVTNVVDSAGASVTATSDRVQLSDTTESRPKARAFYRVRTSRP